MRRRLRDGEKGRVRKRRRRGSKEGGRKDREE